MGLLTSTALLTILTQWLLSMEIGSKQKCNGHQMCLKERLCIKTGKSCATWQTKHQTVQRTVADFNNRRTFHLVLINPCRLGLANAPNRIINLQIKDKDQ